jgi:hypothetical protein
MKNPEKWIGSVTRKDLLTGSEKSVSVETGSEQIVVVGRRDGQEQRVAMDVDDVTVVRGFMRAAEEEVVAARHRPAPIKRLKID